MCDILYTRGWFGEGEAKRKRYNIIGSSDVK